MLKVFCCFSQERPDGRKTLKVISRNLYKELSVEDLRHELLKTKTEILEYEKILDKVTRLKEDKSVEISKYLSKLRIKEKVIKDIFRSKGKEEGIALEYDQTVDFIDEVFNKKKHEANHRMRGLYTYDIKENPDFKESQKTEQKVREYF